jgi:hypothetical protein
MPLPIEEMRKCTGCVNDLRSACFLALRQRHEAKPDEHEPANQDRTEQNG